MSVVGRSPAGMLVAGMSPTGMSPAGMSPGMGSGVVDMNASWAVWVLADGFLGRGVVLVGDVALVLLDEGGVDVDQYAFLPLADRRIGQHRHLDGGAGVVLGIEDPGSDIERLRRDPQRLRQLLQHLGGGFAQAALDLAEVGVGDSGLLCQLTQGELGRAPLSGDELAEGVQLVAE